LVGRLGSVDDVRATETLVGTARAVSDEGNNLAGRGGTISQAMRLWAIAMAEAVFAVVGPGERGRVVGVLSGVLVGDPGTKCRTKKKVW
jgi:hypothetical protein